MNARRKMKNKQSPGEYVINTLGGTTQAAKLLGRNPATIWKWSAKKSQGGTNGKIPSAARLEILMIAKKLKLDITSEDLDYGR